MRTLMELLTATANCIRKAHEGEDTEDYAMVTQADKDLTDLEGPMVASGYLPEQIVHWAYDMLYPPNAETLSATA